MGWLECGTRVLMRIPTYQGPSVHHMYEGHLYNDGRREMAISASIWRGGSRWGKCAWDGVTGLLLLGAILLSLGLAWEWPWGVVGEVGMEAMQVLCMLGLKALCVEGDVLDG